MYIIDKDKTEHTSQVGSQKFCTMDNFCIYNELFIYNISCYKNI